MAKAEKVIDLDTHKGDIEFKRLGKQIKDKNKKRLKQINKAITRLEKTVTQLHKISQKLQVVKDSYTEKKAA